MDRITEISRDGLDFDVLDEGPLDGDVVVLLHGFPERSTSWEQVAPILHEAGLRTIALDQRGYSPRARPPRRRDYALSELAADLVVLLEEIGGPVHLLAHDLGALVGWAVALRRPQLLRTFTALSVPHPGAFRGATLRSQQLRRSWYMGFFQLPRLPERAARRSGGSLDKLLRRSGMTEEQLARFRCEIVDDGALPYALNWYRALPFVDRRLFRLPSLVPTTLVWSSRDGAVDRAGIDETEGYLDAPYELVVLDGVTHWIPTQAPAEAAEAALRRIRSVRA